MSMRMGRVRSRRVSCWMRSCDCTATKASSARASAKAAAGGGTQRPRPRLPVFVDFDRTFCSTKNGAWCPKECGDGGATYFENATDCSVTNSALLDAGHSAFWLQGLSQHIKLEGNRIERPGFCGAYLQGIYPGDTWA